MAEIAVLVTAVALADGCNGVVEGMVAEVMGPTASRLQGAGAP